MDMPFAPLRPSVIFRTGRPTVEDYDEAIEALQDARNQVEPDGALCRVCHDGGHQAWECHHNPLVMARRAVQSSTVWRCYHCGGVFTTYEDAEEHFGKSDHEVARCIEQRAAMSPKETTEK